MANIQLSEWLVFAIKVEALKKAATVMDALAEAIEDKEHQQETVGLARIIRWAVEELETKARNES